MHIYVFLLLKSSGFMLARMYLLAVAGSNSWGEARTQSKEHGTKITRNKKTIPEFNRPFFTIIFFCYLAKSFALVLLIIYKCHYAKC